MNYDSVRFKLNYLGMTKFILRVVDIDGPQKLLCSFLVVNELSFGDHTCIQHFVPTRSRLFSERSFNTFS